MSFSPTKKFFFNFLSFFAILTIGFSLFYFFSIREKSVLQSNNTEITPQQSTTKNTKKQLSEQKKTVSIFFLGDSLTEGLGVDKEESYPSRVKYLCKKAGISVEMVNGGVNGDTTAGGLRRFSWYLKNNQEKLDVLFLALGSNDGLRGLKVENIEKNLSKIIDIAQKKEITVILAEMKIPENYGKKYFIQFNAVFKKLQKKYKIPLMPFLLQDVAGKTELNQQDKIHPNSEGYAVIAKNVFNFLQPIIQKIYERKQQQQQ